MPSNALAFEKSPYLLQHAHNPVDWMPWGQAAFDRARAEGKPIFLSIGYSTCHWCHVMAHESFEDEGIAAVMNKYFVNIKVDREERPDVDLTYMTYLHATGTNGGWPLSAWLTPDLRPFLAGTYFPPADRGGRPGFGSLSRRIGEAWQAGPERFYEQSAQHLEALGAHVEQSALAQANARHCEEPSAAELVKGQGQFARNYDAEFGGFSGAPKFPRPSVFAFLHRFASGPAGDAGQRSGARTMSLHTLRAMAAGGVRDHLGGGFHRYSVDEFWHVPHFEKMLYDQAQLVVAYLEAYQMTGEGFFADVARETLDYVLRDLRSPEGGFYSAEDADSFVDATRTAHAEGAFYVWTMEELAAALPGESELELFAAAYGCGDEGNVRGPSDPFGELRGKNVLYRAADDEELGAKFNLHPAEVAARLGRSRKILFTARDGTRPRPHLDDKILTAWNGLALSALAKGAQVLADPAYADAAVRCAEFIRANLVDAGSGRLLRSHRGGPSGIPAFAADYASLVGGLIDLYEATFDTGWLAWALDLQEELDQAHWDERTAGYLSARAGEGEAILSLREEHDRAEPAPTSLAAVNLLRLAGIMDLPDLRERAGAILRASGPLLRTSPLAAPLLLVALDAHLHPSQHIILAAPSAADAAPFLRRIHGTFHPRRHLVLLDDDEQGNEANRTFLGAHCLFYATISHPAEGIPTAYLCENFTCQLPVTNPAALPL